MPQFIEKRNFRRFEIPGGEVRHKRILLPNLLKHFSKKLYPVLNISVGGIAVLCEEEFRSGEEVIIQLVAPNEDPLNLRSIARWHDPIALSSDILVGFEFMEFGNDRDMNSPEKLKVLQRLYARYI